MNPTRRQHDLPRRGMNPALCGMSFPPLEMNPARRKSALPRCGVNPLRRGANPTAREMAPMARQKHPAPPGIRAPG
ncbi:MAG: hypothetical protein ACOYOF_15560 [Verrucomicrobiaceae bacterium]